MHRSKAAVTGLMGVATVTLVADGHHTVEEMQCQCIFQRGPMNEANVCLLQGEWGPFRPNFPVEVPLWLALALQKKKCCRIQIPAWMNVEHLEGMLCHHTCIHI